ncbi:MAG: helix-turn-helix domain-containing protein [Proteobacteria bacterium]|nr:helix-turn-helix domain-containing protein [Pseudomonadota bacterium]
MNVTEVYFLVLPGTVLMDLAGVGEPFRFAKRFGGEFRLHFIGPKSLPKTFLGLTLQGVEELPQSLPSGAIIFVPCVALTPDFPRPEIGQAAAWLAEVVKPDNLLCTVCTGAFLAALSGLLDGRQCTTHYMYAERLSHDYPKLHVVENRIFVQDGNIYSSAGVTAGVDLALHLISEYANPLVAREVAKFLVIYMRRSGADPQLSPWLVHRNHIHPRIHEVQDMIIRDPCAEWTVAELAERIHTSPRNLTRLFKAHAGIPPLTYLRKVRTAGAKELMTNSNLSMERVAEMAGFTSTEQMRRAWRKFEQTHPAERRRTIREDQGRAMNGSKSSYAQSFA